MTPYHRLLLFAAAAAMAAGCVPTQRAVRGPGARGTEAWSWRMGATEGRWSSDRSQSAARTALDSKPAPARDAAEPEPAAAAEDEVEMTLEPDPVGPAKRPKAVAVAPAPAPRARADRRAPASARPVRASDSDEEFLNKILDDNADAEDGEITMAAVELPRSRKERAAAKKKLAAPLTDPAVDLDADLAPAKPAKKKRMTRAEKRKARLLAKAEKKKAKEIAAREARLRGKRVRIDEDEQKRASHARKAKRKTRKGQFFRNGEGFLDDSAGDEEDEDEDEVAASSDDEEDEDEEDDEDEDEEDDEAPPPRKKSKQLVASSKTPAKPAAKGKVVKVKTDWSGQAIDDEDPLKASKKKK